MGRAPCCDKANVKKGPWSPEEDAKLKEYIEKHGTGGNWIALPQKAGLKRCGKSCRLRWLNYLRPNIKHGEFSDDEDRIICTLFANIGSRWSIIAAQLPGRTDNDIKNYWNTKLKKKLMGMVNLSQRKPHQAAFSSLLQTSSSLSSPSPQLSPSSTISYTCNNNSNTATYYTPARSFTGLEPNSFSNSLLSGNSCVSAGSNILQSRESLLSPVQHYQVKNSVLMFGGEVAASCSSSDGSCNNQINHAKELEYDYGVRSHSGQMGLQNCFYNGVEQNQKFMISNGGEINNSNSWCEQKPSGCWAETSLDYGLEEIKQLITTSSCNSILFDESKTEEKVMYY